MLVYVAQHLKGKLLLKGLFAVAVYPDPPRIMHKMPQQQTHGSLVHGLHSFPLMHKGPHQVLHQVLDRQHIRNLEMKIASVPGIVAEASHNKIPQQILLLPHHAEGRIKKFGKNDKIHRNVILTRRLDFLDRVLV